MVADQQDMRCGGVPGPPIKARGDEMSDKLDKMERLRLAGEAYRAKIAAGEIKRRNPMEKALDNPKSMRAAINANCWDCVGQDNWVNRTRECDIKKCPFWAMRPHQ